MLQQVVLNASSGPVTLDIDAADPSSTIIIKSISGLDPADVTLFTGEYARDGGYYQGRRSGQRNVVLTLKLNPDYANDIEVSDLREQLYTTFMQPQGDGEGLEVQLVDDRKPTRYFIGYTETTKSEIFTRDTEFMASLLCPSPFLYSLDQTTDSDVNGWTSLPITYDGSANVGVQVSLEVKSLTSELNFEINDQQMRLAAGFQVGDIITISTVDGSRWIRQNGSDIMASLVFGSRWPKLSRGANTFRAYGSTWGDGKVVMLDYTYQSAWWGV